MCANTYTCLSFETYFWNSNLGASGVKEFLQELRSFFGKIKKSCAEAQDFVYGGIDLFLNPFSIGVPTFEHNLEFEH